MKLKKILKKIEITGKKGWFKDKDRHAKARKLGKAGPIYKESGHSDINVKKFKLKKLKPSKKTLLAKKKLMLTAKEEKKTGFPVATSNYNKMIDEFRKKAEKNVEKGVFRTSSGGIAINLTTNKEGGLTEKSKENIKSFQDEVTDILRKIKETKITAKTVTKYPKGVNALKIWRVKKGYSDPKILNRKEKKYIRDEGILLETLHPDERQFLEHKKFLGLFAKISKKASENVSESVSRYHHRKYINPKTKKSDMKLLKENPKAFQRKAVRVAMEVARKEFHYKIPARLTAMEKSNIKEMLSKISIPIPVLRDWKHGVITVPIPYAYPKRLDIYYLGGEKHGQKVSKGKKSENYIDLSNLIKTEEEVKE